MWNKRGGMRQREHYCRRNNRRVGGGRSHDTEKK